LNFQGVKAVEDQDGGFVIIGNIIKNDFVTDLVLIKNQCAWGGNVPKNHHSKQFRQRYNGGSDVT